MRYYYRTQDLPTYECPGCGKYTIFRQGCNQCETKNDLQLTAMSTRHIILEGGDDSMEKSQVLDLELDGYQFTGFVQVNGDEVKIKGEFHVTFDGSYSKVEVSPNWIWGIDDIRVVDLEDLRKQIERQDDGTWYYDHMDAMAHRSDDQHEDR